MGGGWRRELPAVCGQQACGSPEGCRGPAQACGCKQQQLLEGIADLKQLWGSSGVELDAGDVKMHPLDCLTPLRPSACSALLQRAAQARASALTKGIRAVRSCRLSVWAVVMQAWWLS